MEENEVFVQRALALADQLSSSGDGPAAAASAELLRAVRLIRNLSVKADHRTVIGQATGILMERQGVESSVAFQALVEHSQHTNRKLHDVAVDLVRTGSLPDLRPASSASRKSGRRPVVSPGEDIA